ncbi:sensor histidine kinase [Nocardioides mangrovicus]|uniref:histidine kinase n=2 Tax=Nocardioides mangrovicus TaxID=2478913 RepID=A0A3L8P043_9ACTN|nr:sensor histidine kinase [Nocardioides mangrovicus]
MLVTLVAVSEVVLRSRLENQLRQRLVDRAVVADALVDRLSGRDLSRRLSGDGVSVALTTASGKTYAEGPPPPGSRPTASPPAARPSPVAGVAATTQDVTRRGSELVIRHTLTDGSALVLSVDTRDTAATLRQVRLVLWLAAALVLLVAAVAVPLVVSRAIAPLRTFTDVARSIGHGDRDRRLRPRQPGTELGRTAVAFDAMLDDVVGAERRALDSEDRLRAFLSDVAHELRTPLTGIQASGELLLREDPPRTEREATLLALLRESGRATRLVEDMLLMARIDEGLQLEPRPVALRPLAEQVVQDALARHPAARLEVSGDDVEVRGDPDRLTQVLGNLVDNALHAGAGTVSVTVRADAPDDVVVDVDDDGSGVPAEDRERIFERLVRLDDARSRHAGGAGLGLPIARGIVRAHGGELVCQDAPVGGARFRVTLSHLLPNLEP